MFKENTHRKSLALFKGQMLNQGYGFICCSYVEFQATLEIIRERFVPLGPLNVSLQESRV